MDYFGIFWNMEFYGLLGLWNIRDYWDYWDYWDYLYLYGFTLWDYWIITLYKPTYTQELAHSGILQ